MGKYQPEKSKKHTIDEVDQKINIADKNRHGGKPGRYKKTGNETK